MPVQAPSGASCFTDYRSNCDIQRDYQDKFSTNNTHELRAKMQNNYSNLVNSTRNAVSHNASAEGFLCPQPPKAAHLGADE